MELYEMNLGLVEGDSNEVVAAKALLQIARDLGDVLFDEEDELATVANQGIESAIEVLKARELI